MQEVLEAYDVYRRSKNLDRAGDDGRPCPFPSLAVLEAGNGTCGHYGRGTPFGVGARSALAQRITKLEEFEHMTLIQLVNQSMKLISECMQVMVRLERYLERVN